MMTRISRLMTTLLILTLRTLMTRISQVILTFRHLVHIHNVIAV